MEGKGAEGKTLSVDTGIYTWPFRGEKIGVPERVPGGRALSQHTPSAAAWAGSETAALGPVTLSACVP